jgi:MFS family permease
MEETVLKETVIEKPVEVKRGHKRGSGYAWAVFVVCFFASLIGPVNQFKVPPLASHLIPSFHLITATGEPDLVAFGWLMSVFGLIGLILALPTLFIVRKLGLKATILVSVACNAIGALIGVLTDSFSVLLLSRIIEGIGIGLVGVAAATAITIWFPPNRRGLPLGIWAVFMPLGMILMFNGAPSLAAALGSWQSIWWIIIICSVVIFILFAIFFKLPADGSEEEVTITATVGQCMASLKNKNIWFLGLAFFFFTFCMLGVWNTYYNTFLEEAQPIGWGMSAVTAAALTSVLTWITLPLQPLMGFINDRVNKRKIFLVGAFILCIIGSIFAWTAGNIGFLWLFLIIAGIGGAVDGAAVRPMAPEVMPPTALGATMGMVVLQFFMNAGAAVGSPVFAAVQQASGWTVAGLGVTLPILALGLIFASLVKSK